MAGNAGLIQDHALEAEAASGAGLSSGAERARAWAQRALFLALPLFALYNVWFPTVPLQERAILGLLAVAAYFVSVPPRSAAWFALDCFHVALGVLIFGYLIFFWEELLLSQGIPSTTDIVLGVIGVYVVMVATVRSLGLGLAAVVGVFLLYTLFGQYLPVWLAGHRGYGLDRIFTFLYINENGIMGFAMDACLKYMALFLILGKVLQYTGALDFIMEFARALFGSGRTGPPLMAVVSSAMVGTVSGSSMGNVYVSGNMTIPLMKRVGLKPELAAAVEAAASNGAQIMPPIMGFAVFFMIVLLDVAYVDIMIAALIPALMYFLSLGLSIWLRVRRLEAAGGVDVSFLDRERPKVGEAMKRMGALSFLLTLGTLIYLLAQRGSLQNSVLIAMVVGIAASMLGRDRLTPKKVMAVLYDSGRELVDVTIACLALGLITGPILLTGLGTKLPALMIGWAAGDLTLLLVCSFIACMVLGLGIPTSMAYVVVALLISNAIVQLGVELLDAHLFVFYAALAAMITPPVALSAYAAATIAKSNYWTTGWLSAALGMPKYLVPFAFVFRPELLMRGGAFEIVAVSLLTLAGLAAVSFGLAVREWRSATGAAAMLCLVIGGILLAVPPLEAPEIPIGGAGLCVAGLLLVIVPRRSHRLSGG